MHTYASKELAEKRGHCTFLKDHEKYNVPFFAGPCAYLAGIDLKPIQRGKGEEARPVDFTGANLSEANLSGANLFRADFSNANLFDSNLSGANLSGASLSGVKLFRANLSGDELRRAIDSAQKQLGAACISKGMPPRNQPAQLNPPKTPCPERK